MGYEDMQMVFLQSSMKLIQILPGNSLNSKYPFATYVIFIINVKVKLGSTIHLLDSVLDDQIYK